MLEIKAGKCYQSRQGDVYFITDLDNHITFPANGFNIQNFERESWTLEGRWDWELPESEHDLIKEVPVPSPHPLPWVQKIIEHYEQRLALVRDDPRNIRFNSIFP